MHDGGFSPRLEERRKANVFVNGMYENNGGKTLYLPEEMSMAQLLNAGLVFVSGVDGFSQDAIAVLPGYDKVRPYRAT